MVGTIVSRRLKKVIEVGARTNDTVRLGKYARKQSLTKPIKNDITINLLF
jgi:hypothetical protein